LSGLNGLLGEVGGWLGGVPLQIQKKNCTKPTRGQLIVESARSAHPEEGRGGGVVFEGLRGGGVIGSAPASSCMHGEQKTEK